MIPILPWDTAKAALKPDTGDDPGAKRLDRLGFWRSVAGLGVVFLASVDYRSVRDVLIGDQGAKVATNAALGLFAVPVLVGVLFFASPARFRPDLLAGVRRMLVRVAVAVVTVGVPILLLFVVVPDGDMSVPVAIAAVVGGVWFLVYFLCVLYWAARTAFWIGECHPMLAPVAASLVVCVVTVNDLVGWDSNGVPLGVWLMLSGAGLVSTLVLAAAEYRHIRDTGVRLTTGPAPLFQPSGAG
jgi:hypothetical protein